MATVSRDPLASRPPARQVSPTPPHSASVRKTSSAKRARSPDPSFEHNNQSAKRPKADNPAITREETKREKERKRAEREREFRDKYTRAFPQWRFHFDADLLTDEEARLKDSLVTAVSAMGARVEEFFSKDSTHLIIFAEDAPFSNKENAKTQPSKNSQTSLLKSPIRLKGRTGKEISNLSTEQLIKKAQALDMKIWSAAKLQSVLERCQDPSIDIIAPTPQSVPTPARERSLTRLLEAERIHGTTERDPTQKRHGYLYFSKQSYFVLVEDMKQELATIASFEYPIIKGRDGKEKPSWPVLYCHPLARGPFVEYDEREEKRRVKAEKVEKDKEEDRKKRWKLREQERKRKAQLDAKRNVDLRRSVSMHNLQRRATCPAGLQGLVPDAEFPEPNTPDYAEPSGYLASGVYMAASGNSVGITSTAGTTSAAGPSLRNLQLPSHLRGKLQHQVVTSRKFMTTTSMNGKENMMGPPLAIPDRPNKLLRKSRSTNTLRLPKREEGTKPGYCESCRMKFEDFKNHIAGKRHRKFAEDDSNFTQLDFVLSRVRRRTTEEAASERNRSFSVAPIEAEAGRGSDPTGEDVQWDDWVETGETDA